MVAAIVAIPARMNLSMCNGNGYLAVPRRLEDRTMNTPSMPNVVRKSLMYDNSPEATLPLSLIWGQLALLAWPTLEQYHSDLFHDAKWLSEELSLVRQAEFWFSFDSMGTLLSHCVDGVATRKNVYLVEVGQVDNDWYFTARRGDTL